MELVLAAFGVWMSKVKVYRAVQAASWDETGTGSGRLPDEGFGRRCYQCEVQGAMVANWDRGECPHRCGTNPRPTAGRRCPKFARMGGADRQGVGAQVLVSNDADAFKIVVDKQGLCH